MTAIMQNDATGGSAGLSWVGGEWLGDCGPSMLFVYTYKLDTSSTIAADKVAGLYVDFHYQRGPLGTVAEYA